MIKEYKVSKHNSTVCGYPGRDFDWTKFCWDGSEIDESVTKHDRYGNAPLPWVDGGLISPNCQYLHVPYAWAERGTIYRVRPNDSMYAGEVYRGHLVNKQTVILKSDGWYWVLDLEE